MSNKLSHSSLNKFQHCPTSWSLHYIQKLRPTTTHAALSFGTALDKSLEVLLSGKSLQESKDVFDKLWINQYLNNVMTYLPTSTDIVYAEADFDDELIDPSSLQFTHPNGEPITLKEINEAISFKKEKGWDNIPKDIQVICNVGYWCTLLTKGHVMLESYKNKVLNKILKVHSTQEKVELKNDEGDEIVGYIDLVAEVQDHGNVILDNKSSAREYKDNAILYSPQLILYMNALGERYNTRKAGFIVLSKQIIKNKVKVCSKCKYDGSEGRAKTCDQEYAQMVESKKGPVEKMVRCNGEWNVTMKPEAYIQFMVDEIPLQAEELVMQNIEDINNSIKHGIFTKNLANCTNSFGKPCDYINYCWRGEMKGLVKKDE